MGASASGGSLVYTDDEISSYTAIFGNAVGNGSGEDDYRKVIAALKALNEGENIEEYFDVDEILRYLAVHTVVVNLDSYSSGMAQNYYIYEHDGVLQILPWDYNYAWGAFQSGSSSDVVNFPVDTPVSSVEMSERPLIAKLFDNEEYFERYHKYLAEITEKYLDGEKFSQKIDELDALIGSYVQNDPTAFYTYEEYCTALAAFKNIGNLRAESISGQLDGTVPSTREGQEAAPDKLTDASSVKLSELGSGGLGGGDRGGFGDFGKFGRMGNSENRSFGDGGFPDRNDGEFSNDFGENNTDRSEQPPQSFGEKPPGGSPPGSFGDMEDPPQIPQTENGNGRISGHETENASQDGFSPPDMQNVHSVPNSADENRGTERYAAVTAAVCIGLLTAAIAGASLVKRKF